MIAIGQLIFYIPFFIMLSILFYYIKWTKKKFSILVASLPCAYFTYQIFSFRHWETPIVLMKNTAGLLISSLLMILWIYYLYKQQK